QHPVSPFAALFLAATNVLILGQDVVMFLGITPEGMLYATRNYWATTPLLHTFLLVPQAWSLSLELLFYAIAPFLVRQPATRLAGLVFACLILRVFIYYGLGLNYDPWTNKLFPIELGVFLAGALSFRLLGIVRNAAAWRPCLAWISVGFLASVLFLGML